MQPEEVGGLLFEIDISRLQNGYNFVKLKKHLGLLVTKYLFYLVAKGGIEPPTQGFSVRLSSKLPRLMQVHKIT